MQDKMVLFDIPAAIPSIPPPDPEASIRPILTHFSILRLISTSLLLAPAIPPTVFPEIVPLFTQENITTSAQELYLPFPYIPPQGAVILDISPEFEQYEIVLARPAIPPTPLEILPPPV